MNTHSSVNEIEIPFSRNNPQRRKIDNGVFHTISGLHLISKWELQNEKKTLQNQISLFTLCFASG